MKLYPNLIKLKDYSPKDRHFTSREEIKEISATLEFDKADSDDLYNYRTIVVSMWSHRYADLRREGHGDEAEKVWQGMQSITAVIDLEMSRRGMEL